MCELSIIIPSSRTDSALRLIRSIKNNAPRIRYEVILVDDSGSEQGRSSISEVWTICNDENIGPARSRNRGAKAARGRWLLFLDDDVEVDEFFFPQLEQHLENSNVVVGLYHYPSAFESFFTRYYHFRLIRGYRNIKHPPYPILGSVFCIRKDDFLNLNGFDERYRYASVEDIDLSRRLNLEKHAILIDSRLLVTHHKRLSIFDLLRSDYLRSRDRVHFLFKAQDRSAKQFDHSERIYILSLGLPWSALAFMIFPSALTFLILLLWGGITFKYNLGLMPDKNLSFSFKATLFALIDYPIVWLGLLVGAVNVILSREKHLFGEV